MPARRRSQTALTAASWRAVPVVLTVVLTVPLAGCGDDDEPGPREGVSTRELTGDLSGTFDIDQAPVGAQTSLRATVDQVLSPGSFVITAADTAGPPLLVLSAEDTVSPGQVLQLIGVLRVFSYDDFADGYPLAEAAAYTAFDAQKVLVASEVDTDLPADDQ